MDNRFYFEIIKNGKVVKRGTKILNTLSWSNELMSVPSTDILLPIEYSQYFSGREEVKLYINGKVFHGVASDEIELDKENETISVNLSHIVSEWNNRQLTTNLAVKNRTIGDIYSTPDFKYSNTWTLNFTGDSASRNVDYVYSRQGKLDGLTKTCELTQDLFWRVGFCPDAYREIDIGVFGDKKPFIFSTQPSGIQNIRIITEPRIKHNFENVVNVAVVYGEKSDSGMSSMSLREVFNDPSLQDPNFPVIILNSGINNERIYNYADYPQLAPNNDLEYAVIDTESIALESGVVIEDSFAFNDLAPFNTDSEEITDQDRITAAKTAYDAAVKKLKQSRRTYQIELTVGELPCDVNVGDKIRFLYDNQVLNLEECSNYLKKILSIDDWFFLTNIDTDFDKNGVEINTVVLEKFLKINRESDRQ